VIGADMKKVISEKVNHFGNNTSISIVPNWSNPEKFILKNKIFKKNTITLQYAGNIGRLQGLKEILNAFRISNNPILHLSIRGSGALYSYVKDFININSLKNVSLAGSFSRLEEIGILDDCDIGIVSLSDGMYGLGVPSKTYHLLAAGKPILYIGEPETEISNLVLENAIGWSVDIRNNADIVNYFNNLSLVDNELFTKMGAKSRVLAETKYSENQILDLLQSKMESVMNSNKN
jgi:glycosyltransferase involved in cell wall biosynthesis